MLIIKGDATKDQKKQHTKYRFNELFFNDLEEQTVSDMFDVYTTNTPKIQDALRNADLELRYEHNKDMKTRVSIYKDNKKEKLESLKEIKAILGIKYTFDKVELSKETLGNV